MRESEESKALNQNDFWEVSHAAGVLARYACSVSAEHIRSGTLRLQFNREVAYYMRGIVQDVESGKKTAAQALKEILKERRSLVDQSLQVVGLVAGGMQIVGGVAMCASTLGAACVPGVVLILHGANNIYENGRNLKEGRSDTVGVVKESYQYWSRKFGGTEAEGNIAYGVTDIALSGYSLYRKVPGPDAWRLFRYIDSDYVHAYTLSKTTTLGIGILSDTATTVGIYNEMKR